jgi:hypothetical protein
MPDTGSPWEIPYAAPADLVRDWPDLSEDVADAVAAGLTAAVSGGIGSNVVQAVKTDTFTTASLTDVLITGLEATITPTSATSKILVIAQIRYSNLTATEETFLSIYRGASRIGAGADDMSAGDRRDSNFTVGDSTIVFLDSPGVATATTYSARVRASAGTAAINRQDLNAFLIGLCSITVIEVAV